MGFELIAAVDLGSNSFRLQIGRVLDGQIYPLDALKEPVRLASGLGADRRLDQHTQERALAALARFGERLRSFAPPNVRAVATNTLRVARNAEQFLPQAERALGFPIDIIAGSEEARLIYLGAIHALPPAAHRRLVVDIGGGSTEFIIGQGEQTERLSSLGIGCVSHTRQFFADGRIDRKRLRAARLAAAGKVEHIAHLYRAHGWSETVGTSGTARAIADLLENNRLNPASAGGISRLGLERLQALLNKAGSAADLGLAGLRADRIPVLAGGVAIMAAVFETLEIEQMAYSDGALRLGVLYDLLGRSLHQDMRAATVEQFVRRYQIDQRQAARVRETALQLLVQPDGSLAAGDEDALFLAWAAQLHEIGISIAHSEYHKHGAYIVTFADMPGFARKEQARLALLVLGHRGKPEKITGLPAGDVNWRLLVALRLAVILRRRRDASPLPPCRLRIKPRGGFVFEIERGWLAAHPLSALALDEEAAAFARIGKSLRIKPLKIVGPVAERVE